MTAFAALLVIAFGACPFGQDPPPEILRVIEDSFPGYSKERKERLARDIYAAIPWDRWGSFLRAEILHDLKFMSLRPLDSVIEGEELSENLKKELENTSARDLVAFPPDFRTRALEIAEAKLRAYVEETLSPGPPEADQRKAMLAQFDALEALMVAKARKFISGPYAEDVIQETVRSEMARIRPYIEPFSPGIMNRPLSEEEYASFVQILHDRASSMPRMAANEPVTDRMSPIKSMITAGRRDTEAAMAAAFEMCDIRQWSDWCYPRYHQAEGMEDDFKLEYYAWKKKMLEEINKQLDAVDRPIMKARYDEVERQIEAAKLKRRHFEPPPKKTSEPAKQQPSSARTGDPSAPRTPVRWVVGAAIILGVLVALSLLLRRARKQAV